MTTKEQANTAKQYLLTLLNSIPATVGLSRDNSGYYLKVHIQSQVTQEIPNTVEGIRVEVVFTGIPKSFWAL